MSMMECAHCQRLCDSRSMTSCDECHAMICSDCAGSEPDCPGDPAEYER